MRWDSYGRQSFASQAGRLFNNHLLGARPMPSTERFLKISTLGSVYYGRSYV